MSIYSKPTGLPLVFMWSESNYQGSFITNSSIGVVNLNSKSINKKNTFISASTPGTYEATGCRNLLQRTPQNYKYFVELKLNM